MTEQVASAPRTKRWPYIVPLAVVLALGGVFAKRLSDISGGYDPKVIPSVLLNTPAPELNLPALPGYGDALTSADLKGEVSLLNIWGSWCAACTVEHPLLMEIAKSGEIPIYGIAWRDKPDRSIAWLEKYGNPYTKIGQDPQSTAIINLGVTAAPESFLIDKEGIIRYKVAGIITREEWREKIQPLIAQLKQ
ncbi:MAG: DsbE family thiol:disulfide interchange protein [Rhodospirillaceae bacterium]